MTRTQRIISIALSGALLLSGFALGKLTDSSNAKAAGNQAENLNAAATNTPAPETADQALYLSDFKTGYSEGYNQGLTGAGAATINTAREGFNSGFKQGFADGYQSRAEAPTAVESGTAASNYVQPVAYNSRGHRINRSRAVYYEKRRPKTSKTRTALRIAAPAAVGAGIGALTGGKKGAGVGALLGGGAGAIYHLIKSRN